jgi:hypothetical protein
MIAVPSDDVLSYRYGYSNEGIGKIGANISPHATDPNRPVIVMPSTDGDNAWGGGSSSWFEATPPVLQQLGWCGLYTHHPAGFRQRPRCRPPMAHIEDGAWIFPRAATARPTS